MNTVVIVLAIIGCIGEAYAAFIADVRIAALAAFVIGLAVLLPLIVK